MSIHTVGKGQLVWQVRVEQNVIHEITKGAAKAAPQETGGYLYGTYDIALRSIYGLGK